MSQNSDDKKKNNGASGLAIPGGLLLGIGIGMLVDNIAAGVMMGLGGGFLIMMIARMVSGEW